jgi:hypothetical protein
VSGDLLVTSSTRFSTGRTVTGPTCQSAVTVRPWIGTEMTVTSAVCRLRCPAVRRLAAQRSLSCALMTSPTATPEAAVRLYLQYLDDPSQLLDAAAVKKAHGAVDKAKDPIDRLKAMAVLERTQSTDGSAYKADFVRYARSWAEEEGVPASAFRELGVPADVLAEAGLDGQPKGRRRSKAGTAPRSRRPPVKTEQVEAGILAMSEPFTVREVADRVGGSPMTIKAVLDRLAEQDKVVDAGQRPATRGRAAKLWKVA